MYKYDYYQYCANIIVVKLHNFNNLMCIFLDSFFFYNLLNKQLNGIVATDKDNRYRFIIYICKYSRDLLQPIPEAIC